MCVNRYDGGYSRLSVDVLDVISFVSQSGVNSMIFSKNVLIYSLVWQMC